MKAATSNLRVAAHPTADKGKTEGASLRVFFVGGKSAAKRRLATSRKNCLRTDVRTESFKVIVFLY